MLPERKAQAWRWVGQAVAVPFGLGACWGPGLVPQGRGSCQQQDSLCLPARVFGLSFCSCPTCT